MRRGRNLPDSAVRTGKRNPRQPVTRAARTGASLRAGGNPGSRAAAQRVCRDEADLGGRSREGRAKPLRTPKRKGGRSLSTETDAGRGPRGARVWRGRTGEKAKARARGETQTGGSVKTFYRDNRRQPGNNRQASQ